MQLIEKAPAKVNLSLGIVGKQADNYHLLEMVNHNINLSDELILTPSNEFEFKVNQDHLQNSENLVIRTIRLFSQLLNRYPDFKIELIKNIPENAGLAGGSSDAAAMIRLIEKYWGLNLTNDQLRHLALKIGADVPYCLRGGTAYVEGIGERVFPLKDFEYGSSLIINPDIKVETPKAFKLIDNLDNIKVPDSMAVIQTLEDKNYEKLREVAGNSFTEPLGKEYPEIPKLIERLYDNEAYYATMSGSGATLIGYFDSKEKRDQALEKFEDVKTICPD